MDFLVGSSVSLGKKVSWSGHHTRVPRPHFSSLAETPFESSSQCVSDFLVAPYDASLTCKCIRLSTRISVRCIFAHSGNQVSSFVMTPRPLVLTLAIILPSGAIRLACSRPRPYLIHCLSIKTYKPTAEKPFVLGLPVCSTRSAVRFKLANLPSSRILRRDPVPFLRTSISLAW